MTPTLIGPIKELLTMRHLPSSGPLQDSQLEIISEGGILTEGGIIRSIGPFAELRKHPHHLHEIPIPCTGLPGFIDAHTHICFAGNRAKDYAQRLNGSSYDQIASKGGGILDTVRKTRSASKKELIENLLIRTKRMLALGVTTCEVKSGYALNCDDEIKMLEAIKEASDIQPVDLISTFLGAHTKPWEFDSREEYLSFLIHTVLPSVSKHGLAKRADIFVEKSAFSVEEARSYLQQARSLGFSLCLHADQFSRGGALLAAELKAISADHLEASELVDFLALKNAKVIPIVLPGASLGLGLPFAQARQMLDCGLPLVIASDWNPGSAPMGNLLTEAALLGMAQQLTMAETLAAITSRASKALELQDRGVLDKDKRCDLSLFPCGDFREILYHQGSLTPFQIYIKGQPFKFT